MRNIRCRSTRAERTLALLIESGIVYFISSVRQITPRIETETEGTVYQIACLVGLPIRVSFGTLGDIYSPINQIVAVCSMTNTATDVC